MPVTRTPTTCVERRKNSKKKPCCTSSLHIVPLSIRSNNVGLSCTNTRPTQPGLQNLPAIQESNSEILETHDSQELEPPLRSNHRQLPRHPPRQISGRRLAP